MNSRSHIYSAITSVRGADLLEGIHKWTNEQLADLLKMEKQRNNVIQQYASMMVDADSKSSGFYW